MTRLRKPLGRYAKFAAILVLALLGALPVPALERERLFGPEIKTGDYKHPASFTELHNGDGLCYYDLQKELVGLQINRAEATGAKGVWKLWPKDPMAGFKDLRGA